MHQRMLFKGVMNPFLFALLYLYYENNIDTEHLDNLSTLFIELKYKCVRLNVRSILTVIPNKFRYFKIISICLS